MAPLDKKYRGKTFNSIIGNVIICRRLKGLLIDKDSFPSTIILQGPSGCGKTTIARIIGRKLKISEVHELNIANQRKIDNARSIIENIRYSSMTTRQGKLIILNEVHKANNEFQNAMLEALEEPPFGVHFILCTTEPDKLLATIKTRADIFQVEKLDRTQMSELIKKVSQKENISITKSATRLIITASDGSPRNALVLLNSIKNIHDPDDLIDILKQPVESEKAKVQGIDLSRALLKEDSYKSVMRIVDKLDEDPELIRRHILEYMGVVLINGKNDKAALIITNFYDDYYSVGKTGLILSVYNCFQ